MHIISSVSTCRNRFLGLSLPDPRLHDRIRLVPSIASNTVRARPCSVWHPQTERPAPNTARPRGPGLK